MAANYLIINSRDEFLRIEVDKIVYFESDGNYTKIYLTNNVKAMVGMNLGQMASMLKDSLGKEAAKFARVGKRHIINLNYTYRISTAQQKLYLSDGERFNFSTDVSKEALKQLRSFFMTAARD